MQDELLSHRILFFIDGQLYFQCGREVYPESLNWATRRLRGHSWKNLVYSNFAADGATSAIFP
jgi:hypothetical protein